MRNTTLCSLQLQSLSESCQLLLCCTNCTDSSSSLCSEGLRAPPIGLVRGHILISGWLVMWEGQVLAQGNRAEDPPAPAKFVKIGPGKAHGGGKRSAYHRLLKIRQDMCTGLEHPPNGLLHAEHDCNDWHTAEQSPWSQDIVLLLLVTCRVETMRDTRWLWTARSTTSTFSQVGSSIPKAYRSLVRSSIFNL